MVKKKEFEKGMVYGFFNYVMWLFAANMYFMLCNILLIIYLIVFLNDIKETYILLYIALLPTAPALTALYGTVGTIIREKDISVTRYFFKSYKSNFKQAFILGFIECTAILVAIVDIKFFNTQNYGDYISPFFMLLILLIFSTGLFIFPILSRFYLKTSDIIKISFVYSIKKINITIFNLSSIVCATFIFYKIPQIIMFFIFSVICYLIMFYEMKILNEIESQIIKVENQQDIEEI